MDKVTYSPRTLQEAVVYFTDADNCLHYLVARRWPKGVTCPTCGRADVSFMPSRRVWQCKTRHPKSQFSVKLGTIFEDSPLGLETWMPAMWMIGNDKNGISSWELHRALGVTQKTAWFMLHRIRLAMQDPNAPKLSGEVEADETFVGGKVKNMHRDKKVRLQKDSQKGNKAVVLGLLQRNGEVRAAVAPSRRKHEIHSHINKNVEPGSKLYTDDFNGYDKLPEEFTREFVNHLSAYVSGSVHTNGMENFWSLLKRTLKGTYVSVDPVHLFRYCDEQVFRYNNRRDMNDSDRFSALVSRVAGKRLTYDELIGKESKKPAESPKPAEDELPF